MGMKFGNKKAGDGVGAKKMGGPGKKPSMPSDNDGDEAGGGMTGGFKRGGKVAACSRGGKVGRGESGRTKASVEKPTKGAYSKSK